MGRTRNDKVMPEIAFVNELAPIVVADETALALTVYRLLEDVDYFLSFGSRMEAGSGGSKRFKIEVWWWQRCQV